MPRLNLKLRLLLTLSAATIFSALSAQSYRTEGYLSGGVLSVDDDARTTTEAFNQTVFFGEDFRVRVPVEQVREDVTAVSEAYWVAGGANVLYPVGQRGEVYGGLRLRLGSFRLRTMTDVLASRETGPRDTVLVDPPDTNFVISDPILFCDGTGFLGGSSPVYRGTHLTLGVPVGYRHRVLGGRVALRGQLTLSTPLLVRHTIRSSTFRLRPDERCLERTEQRLDAADNVDARALQLSAGFGIELNLSPRLGVALTAEQQLTDVFRTRGNVVSSDQTFLFVSVPRVERHRPLAVGLNVLYRFGRTLGPAPAPAR